MIGSNKVGWAYLIVSAITVILSAVNTRQIFGGCFSDPPLKPTGNSTGLKFHPNFKDDEKVIFWLVLALVTIISAYAFYISIVIIRNRPNSCTNLNECTPSLFAALGNICVVAALLTVEALAANIVDRECGPQPYTFKGYWDWIGDMNEKQSLALEYMIPVPCLTFIMAIITLGLQYTNDPFSPSIEMIDLNKL